MTGIDDAGKTVGPSSAGRLPRPLQPYADIFRIPGAWRFGVGLAAGASVVGFILDAHGPRVGYAFAAACGAASAAICLLGLPRLRSPQVPD
jgi:hypothetical protein